MWLLLVLAAFALTILMIVAATVAAFTLVVHLLPLLLILAGIWLLVRALRGPSHRCRHAEAERRHPRERSTGRARTSAPPRPATRQPASAAASRTPEPRELPIDVQVKVEQIRRKAEVLLGFADRFPPFSQDLHIARQTLAEYLPRTIAAYRAVPGDGDPVIRATGRTALEELRAQLELLDAKLDEITRSLQRQDLDRMAANGRFLEQRFGVEAGASDVAAQDTPARRDTDAA